MSDVLQVSIARHAKNYDAMVKFYRYMLGMGITQVWDHPSNCGTLLVFGEKTSHTVIAVIELEDAAWGHRSVGIDDPDGFCLWYYQDMNPK